ncbi:MAG: type 1 periplasmic binding fold superfamily protein [Flavobacteriaceae bacterium]|nr:type 1 periplasmic binding fold superfamily protein [Flavobacteriaceae bacterium]|tara:strand:- start:7325 stop:7885 length:561 start_codon:yes stop_codon:yes gene_type:complete
MKKNIFISTLLILTVLSCSKDDDHPEHVHEHELITTMTITLTPSDGFTGDTITLQMQDLDGDGPNAPTKSVSGNLLSGVFYDGAVVLLNESESPAENITSEIEEEDEEHQFFITPGGGLIENVGIEYINLDSNGNILGTQFQINTFDSSSGTLTFTLRHEPTKPNTGLADAGGATDVEATFNVTIE